MTETAMKPTPAPKRPDLEDGLTQSERFMQAARELECDDDPERFKERVRKVAKAPGHRQSADSSTNRQADISDDAD